MKRKLNTSDGEVKHHSFFKLMISPTSFSKLRIPENFARDFQYKLCAPVALTVPSGETKRVAVVKEDNKLWFKDGWKEFVQYFSVGYGYFLLFTYDGKSSFRVNIFDLTACEICYKSKARSGFLAEINSSHTHLSSGSAMKELCIKDNDSDMKDALIDIKDDEMELEEGNKLFSNTKQEIDGNSLGSPSWLRNYPLATKRTRKINAIVKAVSAANISIPERPYFISLINSRKKTCLHIPAFFAKKHMMKWKKGDLVMFETSDGRQQAVQFYSSKQGCYFGKGWIMFAREIGLEGGDVCVLELSDTDKYLLNLQVAKKYRKIDAKPKIKLFCASAKPYMGATPLGCHKQLRINYDGVVKAVADAGIPTPTNPFFVTLIRPNHLRYPTMWIPLAFAKEHLRSKNRYFIQIENSDGRRWEIQCCRGKNHCCLGRGWPIFVRENGLEVGDICVFELGNAGKYVLKVQVVKKYQIEDDTNLLV